MIKSSMNPTAKARQTKSSSFKEDMYQSLIVVKTLICGSKISVDKGIISCSRLYIKSDRDIFLSLFILHR